MLAEMLQRSSPKPESDDRSEGGRRDARSEPSTPRKG
jgi:hypothetical protein